MNRKYFTVDESCDVLDYSLKHHLALSFNLEWSVATMGGVVITAKEWREGKRP